MFRRKERAPVPQGGIKGFLNCCQPDEEPPDTRRRIFSFGKKRKDNQPAEAYNQKRQKSASSELNPSVFFDVAAGSEEFGTLYFEVYLQFQPVAAHAFLDLVAGQNVTEDSKPLHYKGTKIMLLDRDTIVGGDFGGLPQHSRPVYTIPIAHANRELQHTGKGTLWMPLFDENRMGSQFVISMNDTPWLSGNHLVVGKLIGGFEVLERMMSSAEYSDYRVKYCEKL